MSGAKLRLKGLSAFIVISQLSFFPVQSLASGRSAPQAAEAKSEQLIPRSQDQREGIYKNLHRVVLSVQVSDSSGQQTADLKQSDFAIFVDHQPKKMALFQSVRDNSTHKPAHVIVVLDGVNNSSGKLKHFRKAVEKYLEAGSGPLANPTSIALFSDTGMELDAPSKDRAVLLADMNRLAGNFRGSSCADTTAVPDCMELGPHLNSRVCDPNPHLVCLDHLFDSSITALTSLAQQEVNGSGRVIVIWIGNGWPLLNGLGFTPDSPELRASFYRDLVTVSSALAEAHVTLDAVTSSEALPVSPKHAHESIFFQGVSNEDHASAASLSLQVLAYQSGGLVLTNSKNIAGQIARCVADSDSYYSLAFDYPPASQPGEYHSIAVKIDRPDISVRTRTLYYAEQ